MSRDSLANGEKRNLNLSLDSKFHESKDVTVLLTTSYPEQVQWLIHSKHSIAAC